MAQVLADAAGAVLTLLTLCALGAGGWLLALRLLAFSSAAHDLAAVSQAGLAPPERQGEAPDALWHTLVARGLLGPDLPLPLTAPGA